MSSIARSDHRYTPGICTHGPSGLGWVQRHQIRSQLLGPVCHSQKPLSSDSSGDKLCMADIVRRVRGVYWLTTIVCVYW
jgi:hypothetical protein